MSDEMIDILILIFGLMFVILFEVLIDIRKEKKQDKEMLEKYEYVFGEFPLIKIEDWEEFCFKFRNEINEYSQEVAERVKKEITGEK